MTAQSTLESVVGPSARSQTEFGNEGRDKELRDAAEHRLRRSAYLELRRVQCDFQDGVLTLAGNVSSHYLRQIAQATVQTLEGITAIDNQLEVFSYGIGRDGWGSE